MTGYILSILGIVVAGIMIDIVVPVGSTSKYIQSIYSIFVIAVIVSPLMKFLSNKNEISIKFEDYAFNQNLLTYIYEKRVENLESAIEDNLSLSGFSKIDIILKYSIENNDLIYNSCIVNLEKMVISTDKQHINKYEFITGVVKEYVELTNEEIIVNE